VSIVPALSRHRRLFPPVLASLVTLAWLTLWLWARSPYGRYLDHGDWTASGPAAWLCHAVPGGALFVPAALYALSWTLMILAMMLPTTLSLFNAFDRVVSGRPDHARLLALLGAGYLAAWSVFGLLVHGLHALLLAGVAQVPVLAWHNWLIGVATLAGAGAFQFSQLKYQCLDKCRTPLSFVISHWQGRAHARQAFVLGLRHGLFCVGCCWALMLLMFVVGAGSLGWMLVLAAAMAIEKNVAWGRRLSAPLGVALLAGAAWLAATHVWGVASIG
jgi:predicted metal-binding membrane protein